MFIVFSSTSKSIPGTPTEPPERGPCPSWSHVLNSSLSPELLFCIGRSLGCVCGFCGTACREDELGSQSHILKMCWLIREKPFATSLRSSCPVLPPHPPLDLMVIPFPFKRVLCLLCVPPRVRSEDSLNTLLLSCLVGPGDGTWVSSSGSCAFIAQASSLPSTPLPKQEAYLQMTVPGTSLLLFILSRLATKRHVLLQRYLQEDTRQ